jgi:thiol-disulfide isomerase/thioredoxin
MAPMSMFMKRLTSSRTHMKTLFATLAAILLITAGLTLSGTGVPAPLPGSAGRPVPEWQVSKEWINSKPLRLADLRGKVVLVDFWTYSCINCLRTVPYLNRWYEQYKDRGFVVVGIHTPEFEFEGMHVNVDDAVRRLGIQFPVAQDNDFATWKRYDNLAWPAFYLIDREGKIVFSKYGEGGYGSMENLIRQLLGVDGAVLRDNGADLGRIRTPEIYLGTAHENHETNRRGGGSFDSASKLRVSEFALSGKWSRVEDRASLLSGNGTIALRFNAAKVHLVAGAVAPTEIIVRVDGGAPLRVTVARPQLYTLYDGDEYREHTIQIEIPQRGFDAYSFTFG